MSDQYSIISFPKCGRTWLRLLIGKILKNHYNFEDNINLLSLNKFYEYNESIPSIEVSHDNNPQYKQKDELVKDKSKYKDKKVIFLVRDPRDVLVSLYFHRKKRDRRKKYNGTLSEFVYQPVGGIDSIIEFYNIWAKNKSVPEAFLLIKYEELRENTYREIEKVLSFLRLDNVKKKTIKKAIEYCSFKNMRKLEKNNEFSSILKPMDPEDIESYKTRRGVVGGYKSYLNREEINYLNRKMKKLSDFYNYNIYSTFVD
ncbi:sulfotransferase domain-containing protein [Salibacterium salarium]|nr:sulfotransferase domain-containing protein [Salibacterium salarium]